MATLDDVTGAAEAYGSEQFSAGVDSGAASRQGEVDSLSLEVTAATSRAVTAEQKLADYIATHPDLAATLFGFWAGTTAPGAGGGARANYDRVAGYLLAQVYRMFYSGMLPANIKSSNAGFGPPVVVSFKASPKDIVAGKYDAILLSFVASLPPELRVWLTYWHEPEDDIEGKPNANPPVKPAFSAEEYRAAWAHIVALLPKSPNLRLTLILMEFTLRKASRKVVDYVVPGLDVLAWDCYWTAGMKSAGERLDACKKVSDSYGLGFGVAECAVDPGFNLPGMTHAQTVLAAAEEVRTNPRAAEFVTWFESFKVESDGNAVDWRVLPFADAVAVLS